MKKVEARWDLSEIEVSASGKDAALVVVERMTRDKDDIIEEWATAVRLAHANGATLRDIAERAQVSPQTVANLCAKHRPRGTRGS